MTNPEKVRLTAKEIKWFLTHGDEDDDMMETMLYMAMFRNEYIGTLGESNGDEGEDEAWKITFPNGYWGWFNKTSFLKKYIRPEDYKYKPEYF